MHKCTMIPGTKVPHSASVAVASLLLCHTHSLLSGSLFVFVALLRNAPVFWATFGFKGHPVFPRFTPPRFSAQWVNPALPPSLQHSLSSPTFIGFCVLSWCSPVRDGRLQDSNKYINNKRVLFLVCRDSNHRNSFN